MKKNTFAPVFLAMLVFASCGNDDNNDNGTPPPTSVEKKITTLDMSFSPSTLNAVVGEKITFIIGAGHTATRVDEATWNANGTTSNGGFDYSEGSYTYEVQPSDVGTIYYVCLLHVTMGMKGTIIVTTSSSSQNGGY